MIYKVWIHIEEIDEEANHYEDVGEPVDVGCFDSETEAIFMRDQIEAHFNVES